MTLHLGVVEVPYATKVPDELRRIIHRVVNGVATTHTVAPSGGETTGDVARILEDRYHIIELFYEEVGHDLIVRALENSMQNALVNVAAGQPIDANFSMTAQAEEEIAAAFRLFIEQQELDGVEPGVPTAAALAGVNHWLKHPYAKANMPRPSFDDTGLYNKSFRAWVD